MKPVAEIFSQGEEVVRGQIADLNAAWLSERLTGLGFAVKRHNAVGDSLDDLVALIREISQRADCCICTGGLGPTCDDMTTEAVGIAATLDLRFDADAFEEILHYFSRRDRIMPEINRKQAMLPETAVRIDNPIGTAPGFALKIERCRFVFLPGVPSEMKIMFDATVGPQLQQQFKLRPDCLVTLRTLGIGESAIQQCLASLPLPDSVQLGFRASVDEVQTKLLFPAGFDEREKQVIVGYARALIGDYVFAVDGLEGRQGDLLAVVDRLMREHGRTLAVFETASQGLLAAKCLGRAWLKSAEICLDIEKGLQDARLSSADWEGASQALAGQLSARCQVDLALVQLYLPESDDQADPVFPIVLYNALHTPNGTVASQIRIVGTAKRKQNQAALLALDLLRRYLQNQCH